jgi:hypothetical protein
MIFSSAGSIKLWCQASLLDSVSDWFYRCGVSLLVANHAG